MYKRILFIIVTFVSLSSQASLVLLKGKLTLVNGNLPSNARLFSFVDATFEDTASIQTDGTFRFNVEVTTAGLYTLRINQYAYDIFFSKTEPELNFTAQWKDEVLQDLKLENSIENEAYKQLTQIRNYFFKKIADESANCLPKDSCATECKNTIRDLNNNLTQFQEKYKGSFVNDHLVSMINIHVDESSTLSIAEQVKKSFFNQVPFNEKYIFGDYTFNQLLSLYAKAFLSKGDEAAFLDNIYEKSKNDEYIKLKTLKQLFDFALYNQKENLLAAYAEWIKTHAVDAENAGIATRAKKVARVLGGNPFIDISGRTILKKPLKLSEIVPKNKATLVIFWSSECSHCREEIPIIQSLYKKYKSKGLEVFGASIDPNEENWSSFVQLQELPWQNVYLGRMVMPENIGDLYNVITTPSIFLVQQNGKIFKRFVSSENPEEEIINALKN